MAPYDLTTLHENMNHMYTWATGSCNFLEMFIHVCLSVFCRIFGTVWLLMTESLSRFLEGMESSSSLSTVLHAEGAALCFQVSMCNALCTACVNFQKTSLKDA
jgi:hypothetical protein